MKTTSKKQNQPKTHASKSKAACKIRRRKIIRALAEGKTNKQAGIEAGLSPKTAPAQVTAILKEPETQSTFQELLKEVIPDDLQTSKYLECLNATKCISAMVVAPGGEGMKDANSMTKDFVEVPDYPTRLRANDSISKLKGHLIERSEVGLTDKGQGALDQMSDEELEKRAREIINQRQ